MKDLVKNYRFVVKPVAKDVGRSLDLARPMKIHPLTYQELPLNPEYTNYADGRFTLEKLSNASADEMYWKARQEVILRHTGEHPYEISGPDAEKLLQKIFTRDIAKVKTGRCSYQFACYDDGGMISDGLLLKLTSDKFWFAQGDGHLFSWYKAHSMNLDVEIKDPNVWVSQIQGPKSLKLLNKIVDEPLENKFNYFDWIETSIAYEKVIISRTGFTNELGWEIYLRPENDSKKIGDLILEKGKEMGMILTASPGFRCRRIEAGLLSAGRDFTKERTPFSVGLGKFIDFNKGDFIGRNFLEKADKECLTWGMRVEGSYALVDSYIFIDNKKVGIVTSSTWSPYQVCGVSIVHMSSKEYGPETEVKVLCDDGKYHNAEICSLPMYDPDGDIPRGLKEDIPSGPSPWKGILKN
jgi:glycine cleavage system aminomethyltransferase T